MKLVFCESCQDVIRLQSHIRQCKCGKSGGLYESDGLHAHYWGIYAKPLGFSNPSFRLALDRQPMGPGKGQTFEAFVIPHRCDTLMWHEVSLTVSVEDYPPAFIEEMRKTYLLPQY